MTTITSRGYSEEFVIGDIPTTYSNVRMKEEKPVAIENFTEGKELPWAMPTKWKVVFSIVTILTLAAQGDIGFAQEIATSAEAGLPPEIGKLLTRLQVIGITLAGGIAAIMGIVAGYFRIVGLREESKKRFADAVIGLIMVLAAPTALFLIATIVKALLSILPGATF